MNIKLREDERYIFFMDGIYALLHSIKRFELGDSIDLYDYKISACVYDLTEYSWATKEMAMQLCKIIKDEFPDNDIDWDATEGYITQKYDT
jgi:hypothetical protein